MFHKGLLSLVTISSSESSLLLLFTNLPGTSGVERKKETDKERESKIIKACFGNLQAYLVLALLQCVFSTHRVSFISFCFLSLGLGRKIYFKFSHFKVSLASHKCRTIKYIFNECSSRLTSSPRNGALEVGR